MSPLLDDAIDSSSSGHATEIEGAHFQFSVLSAVELLMVSLDPPRRLRSIRAGIELSVGKIMIPADLVAPLQLRRGPIESRFQVGKMCGCHELFPPTLGNIKFHQTRREPECLSVRSRIVHCIKKWRALWIFQDLKTMDATLPNRFSKKWKHAVALEGESLMEFHDV